MNVDEQIDRGMEELAEMLNWVLAKGTASQSVKLATLIKITEMAALIEASEKHKQEA